jgi:hypothetical protein
VSPFFAARSPSPSLRSAAKQIPANAATTPPTPDVAIARSDKAARYDAQPACAGGRRQQRRWLPQVAGTFAPRSAMRRAAPRYGVIIAAPLAHMRRHAPGRAAPNAA